MTRETSSYYQTSQQLEQLLIDLVEVPSVTQSASEVEIAFDIHRRIAAFPYFQKHPAHLKLYPVGGGRNVVAALVLAENSVPDTAVLIAHYDVVDVEDYGVYATEAFSVNKWTKLIKSGDISLPAEVEADLESRDWLFGRGVMDMKCGLAINMALLEQACNGHYAGNVLFLAVPDEERHSDGMIGAAPLLAEWGKTHGLRYRICIDTEPSLAEAGQQDLSIIYSGTGGKMLLGALCIGKETHVEAPFEGLSGSLMIGELTRALELNPRLAERIGADHTSPPICLWSRDLRTQYSVSIPNKAAAYYNLLFMEREPCDVLTTVREIASEAMASLSNWVAHRIEQTGQQTAKNLAKDIQVSMFDDVLKHARQSVPDVVEAAEAALTQAMTAGVDMRDATLAYVNEIASACKALQPIVVLFIAPPYYPAISSSADPTVRRVISAVQAKAKSTYGVDVQERRFFPGLCDLSYTGIGSSERDIAALSSNMPLLGQGYDLPIDLLRTLEIPVLNFGPSGKDAHMWTERLERDYSLNAVPELLRTALNAVFAG